jgi:hypothetical protein
MITDPGSSYRDFTYKQWSYVCRLCGHSSGLDPEVPSSIPGTTRFSEYQWVSNGLHTAS